MRRQRTESAERRLVRSAQSDAVVIKHLLDRDPLLDDAEVYELFCQGSSSPFSCSVTHSTPISLSVNYLQTNFGLHLSVQIAKRVPVDARLSTGQHLGFLPVTSAVVMFAESVPPLEEAPGVLNCT